MLEQPTCGTIFLKLSMIFELLASLTQKKKLQSFRWLPIKQVTIENVLKDNT